MSCCSEVSVDTMSKVVCQLCCEMRHRFLSPVYHPSKRKFFKKVDELSKIQTWRESNLIVYFFLRVVFSCFFLKKKINSKKQTTQSWCRAKHFWQQAMISWNPICLHGSLGKPLPLCSCLSLGWLCCWQHLLSCFSTATWQNPLFHRSFCWNVLDQGLIGTGASLGWEAWWRAVVARGCWGSIAWGTAEGLAVLPVTPGFDQARMRRRIS